MSNSARDQNITILRLTFHEIFIEAEQDVISFGWHDCFVTHRTSFVRPVGCIKRFLVLPFRS